MKTVFTLLAFLVSCFTAISQPNWSSITIEGQKAYSISCLDSKGNKCDILLFYNDTGFIEAWFTMPNKVVEHEDMPRFSVYWRFSYTDNNKQETVELGGRYWSCLENDKLDQKLEKISDSTIVVSGALGSAPFFEYITKSQKPVVLILPTASGDLYFTVPVLERSK